MTTIAYRDGVLACDRILIFGDNAVDTDKKIRLFKRKDKWIGIITSGDLINSYTFMDWYEKDEAVHDKIKLPNNDKDNNYFGAIVVEKSEEVNDKNSLLEVTYWDQNMYCLNRNDYPYLAYGAGSDLALGAMCQGATAIEAIEAANHHSLYSGYGVMWIDFNVDRLCIKARREK